MEFGNKLGRVQRQNRFLTYVSKVSFLFGAYFIHLIKAERVCTRVDNSFHYCRESRIVLWTVHFLLYIVKFHICLPCVKF